MDKRMVFEKIKKFLVVMRKISAGKVLLIWALTMAAGVFLFILLAGNPLGRNVTLVFASWWEDELDGEALTKLSAEYEAENQGITIKFEKMSWEEILELLEGKRHKETGKSIQKLSSPDIFSIDPYAIYDLEKNSLLAVLENDKDASANVVSIISFIHPLYYNIDLLEEAGFDRPPKNQTEFLSYVQRLKETGVNGAGLALGDPSNISRQILSWIWAAAGNPESSEPFNFTAKEVIDTLNFLNQLKQNLFGNPFELNEAELLEAFGKGKIGMMIGSIADIQELKTTKINFSITTIPAQASYSKKPVFPLTVWYAGINSKCEFQEEAKDFISFLKKNSGTIAEAAYAVPGNETLNRELSKKDPHYTKAFDMYEAGEMVRELYPNNNRINKIIYREVELMFQGNKTPEQCAHAIQQEWEWLSGALPAVY